MCNLYTLRVERWNSVFDRSLADVLAGENLPPPDVYPASPGIVITADKTAHKMTWGFPLVLKAKEGQPLKPKPVNNARTDKLASPFWSASVRERRCLIPVDSFAEAEGPKGKMTRTWFSMPDGEQFHCAGVWRDSAEWGKVYSMIMTEAAGPVELATALAARDLSEDARAAVLPVASGPFETPEQIEAARLLSNLPGGAAR